MKKLPFILGGTVGFLVGSKMGRGPYESVVATATSLAKRPEVQDMVDATKDRVGSIAGENVAKVA